MPGRIGSPGSFRLGHHFSFLPLGQDRTSANLSS
jgi:hypothetical protein